ncbi:molybdopterin-guanine dinucleotide biosynthesis protein B [Falsibacillus albus]|uniref:Molybdopterin-guanine dinucleotide biosynthesis protein B n=1 Tax=Falsibacillus albus TaxID=2478915 RepID=A0A3L7K0P2_9BACI|nr:molybdopterin-guanine dinucleotide biosynthesis protein B [Falsibacillus albus]RLQ96647.1 molybdopterin-guanine dinucleotide biosynthesis protein B [Falsibacillus albus]
MGEYCPILQIVGYQNSGKTTLMQKLIVHAKEKGLSAASIKHHGHGSGLENSGSSKDSSLHFQAGALVSSVNGEGVLQLSARIEQWGLDDIIELYRFFLPDLIFIEGYKNASYPKVVLIRNDGDFHLLKTLKNIMCIISEVPISEDDISFAPIFSRKEEKKFFEYIWREITK